MLEEFDVALISFYLILSKTPRTARYNNEWVQILGIENRAEQ